MVRTLSHVFFLDPSPVRRVPIQTGIQRKLNFVSVRTIKGSSSAAAAMGTSWAWTGAPARHRRPGEDRRCGCAFSTVVRRGTALESSYHRRHCSPKRRLAKGCGMREFTTRCSTACASVRIRFKEMAPFFFRVLEPSAPTTLTSWGRLPVRDAHDRTVSRLTDAVGGARVLGLCCRWSWGDTFATPI